MGTYIFLASSWIPLALLIGLAGYARLLYGSWLDPSTFPTLVWSVFIFVALVIAPEYDVSGIGVWVILALILASHLGAALVGRRPAPNKSILIAKELPVRRWLGWVTFFACLSMAGAVLFGVGALSENDLPLSLSGVLALGHILSVARYAGVQEPAIVRALWIWVFPAALLGGVTFVLARHRLGKCLSLAAFVPALVFSFLETTRGGFVIAMCCWLGGFFSTKVCATGGRYNLFNRRAVVAMSALVLTICVVFVIFDAVRIFSPKEDFAVEADSSRFKAYFVGSLSFFDNWVSRDDSLDHVTLGTQTFRSFFEVAGIQEWHINPTLTLNGGGETNIPTAFGGLIQDFTLPGGLLICLAWGYAAGLAFEKAKRGNLSGQTVLAAYYALFLFSPIVALTVYNGPIFAWIVLSVILRSAVNKRSVSSNTANI